MRIHAAIGSGKCSNAKSVVSTHPAANNATAARIHNPQRLLLSMRDFYARPGGKNSPYSGDGRKINLEIPSITLDVWIARGYYICVEWMTNKRGMKMRYQILCSDGSTDFNDGPDSQRWGDDLPQMIESADHLKLEYPQQDYIVAESDGRTIYTTAVAA